MMSDFKFIVSDFKMLKVKFGIVHYGYVKLKITESLKSKVINSISKPVNRGSCEIDESSNRELFDAVVNGINQALKCIIEKVLRSFIVEIICIKGDLLDTTPEDIRATAFIAVIRAVLDKNIEDKLELINDRWNIIFD
jgi:hypothetical protein